MTPSRHKATQTSSIESQPAPKKKPAIRPTVLALLAVVIALGAGLRFSGITWSLPDSRHPHGTYHPDEFVDFSALQFVNVLAGKFDIGFYNYGTFYFYLADVSQTIGHGYGAIPNTPTPPPDAPKQAPMEKAAKELPETRGIYLAGRLLSALMGVLTIPVLFAIGKRLYGDKEGLAAALLYAVMPLAAVHAHFFTVDVTATFFSSLVLLAAANLLHRQTWREYALAGLWTGLAAATKYSVGILIVAPIAAHFLACRSKDAETKRWNDPKALPVLGAATAIAFLLACPGPIIDWNVFWNGLPRYPDSGVAYELLQHPRQGHGLLFVNTGPGWWYHLIISLRYGMGIPALVLAIAGIVVGLKAKTNQDRLLLWVVLVYYGITGLSGVRFARYMIPLYPALCLITARLLSLPQYFPRRQVIQRVANAALGTGALLTAGYAISLIHVMVTPDPRDRAADVILTRSNADHNGAELPSVGFAKVPWYFSPPLSPWFGERAAGDRRKCIGSAQLRFVLPAEDTEFDTAVLDAKPDYLVISNVETTNELRLKMKNAERFLAAIPSDYKIQEFAPPPIFDMAFSGSLVPDDLLYILPHIKVYSR